MLWGRPVYLFLQSSVFILTKHARKITMGLAAEKIIIHRLPTRQFYDADNFLITLGAPALCEPSLLYLAGLRLADKAAKA